MEGYKNYEDCYIRYPKTFYGLHSHFKNRPQTDIATNSLYNLLNQAEDKLENPSHSFLKRIKILYTVGEKSLADQLIILEKDKAKNITFFIHLSKLLIEKERFTLLVSLISDYHYDIDILNKETGNKIRSLYYPLAYQNVVNHYAEKFQVPELLVYSVMREESRFQAEIESNAGAHGLLQLMPKTAKYMGKLLRKKVEEKELIIPEINIELGVVFLKRLLRRYKGNRFYTLAAYNGGPTNVRRWRKRLAVADEDYFLESISFNETKNYVKKVLRSYYNYQLIYGSLY